MNTKRYTYRLTGSPEDGEPIGLCGEFHARIPPLVRRKLALLAAEQGGSLNRLASAKPAVCR